MEPTVDSPEWDEWFEMKERQKKAEQVLKTKLEAVTVNEARLQVFYFLIVKCL
jgi:hypothetical protein